MNLNVPVYQSNTERNPHPAAPPTPSIRRESAGASGWGSLQRRKKTRPVSVSGASLTATPPAQSSARALNNQIPPAQTSTRALNNAIPPAQLAARVEKEEEGETLSSSALAQWFREREPTIHDLPLQVHSKGCSMSVAFDRIHLVILRC